MVRHIILVFLFLNQLNLLCQDTTYLPTSTTGDVYFHSNYSLSYSESHEQAEWVYYKLTRNMVMGSNSRTNNFRVDPIVKTGSANLSDYKGSGYDRGHLAPAADMKHSYKAMSESFYLSNMSPQDPSFNRGAWKKLESITRNWAKEKGFIYIATGPILNSIRGSIGNGVSVPNYYYKIAFYPKDLQMIAFIMPNRKVGGQLKEYAATVNEVEQRTNIDFFHSLPDSIENKLESKINITYWTFTTATFNSSSLSSTSVQCKGIAKSTGNRCKNKTKNENGYCYIHQSQSPDYVAPKKTSTGSKDGRCMATTKAATRCKRNAATGSCYCWQHQK
jgi:endonuclease G